VKPFAVILGILTGSLVAIAFGLGVVAFIFWLLGDDHARFAAEWPMLLRSTSLFAVLAILAAAGFAGVLRVRPWRFPVLALLWAGLLATGWYYWP
jgi:hypothetical protein